MLNSISYLYRPANAAIVAMIIVKLGGSVITDKTNYRIFHKEETARLAAEIANSRKQVVIVHGAGSFGHVLAERFQLQHGLREKGQVEGAARVMEDVRYLNLQVIRTLNDQGLFSISIPPSAAAQLDAGKLVSLDTDKFRAALLLNLTPVTFGDVVLDKSRGFGICSGDKLIEHLAKTFTPERIIFCADVDGIYDCDPSLNPEAKRFDLVDESTLRDLPRTQKCADVTGSIFGKLESMLHISSYTKDCMVINGNAPGRLEAALNGGEVIGTRVRRAEK